MKYLYHHETTKAYLKAWSCDATLICASFFFWSLGTTEQKSHDGLSRALLYNVLDADPSLIPKLLPAMWREAYESDGSMSLPSTAETHGAFNKLAHLQDNSPKFCFFIDGLDEYSGNYADGIAFIKILSQSPNIKIIVSSRPIPACVQAFSGRPKIHLQDLTRDDIALYVNERIGAHPYMSDLLTIAPNDAENILSDLVEKASGVFLWVVLACNSLLEGFAACDGLSDLRQRVDELPPELESLFHHMLSKMEARYQDQAARLLRICHQNKVTPGAKPIFALGLSLLDDHKMDPRRITSFQ